MAADSVAASQEEEGTHHGVNGAWVGARVGGWVRGFYPVGVAAHGRSYSSCFPEGESRPPPRPLCGGGYCHRHSRVEEHVPRVDVGWVQLVG